jgi:predicted nuclease with TOPRIM domain
LRVQEAKAQQLQEKYTKSKEKNSVLKENNRILTDQVQQIQGSYDALVSEFKRKEHQLTGELKLVSQVR